MKRIGILGILALSAAIFAETLPSTMFTQTKGFVWSDNTLICDAPELPGKATWYRTGIWAELAPAKYAGKKIMVTAEARWLAPANVRSAKGIIQIIPIFENRKENYFGTAIEAAKIGEWREVKFVANIAPGAKKIRFFIGFQKQCGKFELRNLKLEDLGTALDLAKYGNRALQDEVAEDGKGGWTDQGPDSDGRMFHNYCWSMTTGGVPFSLAWRNPMANSILVMRSKHAPTGALEQEIPVTPTRANYLYMLHTLSYAGSAGTTVGRIIVTFEGGQKTELPVVAGRDVNDWWNGKAVTNGSDFLRKRTRNAEHVLYITRYELPKNDKKVTSVRFISENEETTWIICSALLSDTAYKMRALPPKQPLTIKANAEWQPAVRNDRYNVRRPGSVLDVSRYVKYEPITEENRVIVKGNHFYHKNDLTKPVRFFNLAMHIDLGYRKQLETREKITQQIEDAKLYGYNMIQVYTHPLMKSVIKEGDEFNKQAFELMDWLFHTCRQNGIYVEFILLPRKSGFYPRPEYSWGDPIYPFDSEKEPDVFFGMHFLEKYRQNWEQGVTKILNHRNQFNGTLWKDEPAILTYGGANEQEFSFNFQNISPTNQAVAVGPYRTFLKNRYATIAAYNQKWGTKFNSFDEIPCFNIKEKNSDVNDFLYETCFNLLKWEQSVFRKIGIKGYTADSYNFTKSLTYHFSRRNLDVICMHIYHDHPLGNIAGRGGYNKQNSAIERGNDFFRTLIGSRSSEKPLLCAEYDQPFWNQYRYERSFVVPAYASFNDIDGITVWYNPVLRIDFENKRQESWMTSAQKPFFQPADPMGGASELLAFFLYKRGDVQPTKHFVRILADKESVFKTNPIAAPAPEQTALSLLTGYYQQNVDTPKEFTPAAKNETLLPSLGGGKMRVEGFFTEAVGATKNISDMVNMLKNKGVLTQDNRSNGDSVYENASKELFMNIDKKYMTINTPRFQGMCGLAGAKAKLADFEVVSHSKDGNLSLVAVDGMTPIRNAKRLLLVRLTNSLNSNMKFTDKDMCQLVELGSTPALLRNSEFTVKIQNENAAKLKLYPLSLEGDRTGKVIAPTRVDGNTAEFTVNTAKDGNTVYFEIVAGESF